MLKQKTLSESQQAQLTNLANIESELTTVLSIQDNANQASIWAFNAWGSSDAFIARSEHAMLIKRLEQVSLDADEVKAQADVLVRRLRGRKRELTQQLGSHVNDKQMQVESERAVKKAKDAAQLQIDAHAQVETATSQTKQSVKPKNKTELIVEAKKQTASKKKAA